MDALALVFGRARACPAAGAWGAAVRATWPTTLEAQAWLLSELDRRQLYLPGVSGPRARTPRARTPRARTPRARGGVDPRQLCFWPEAQTERGAGVPAGGVSASPVPSGGAPAPAGERASANNLPNAARKGLRNPVRAYRLGLLSPYLDTLGITRGPAKQGTSECLTCSYSFIVEGSSIGSVR